MSKKVVVITGSPRKKGNSFAMTDAFIKAAEEKGHTVTRFDAAMMKIYTNFISKGVPADAAPANHALRQEKSAPSTMLSTRLPRRFWNRTRWSLPCRFTGTRSPHKSSASSTSCFLSALPERILRVRNVR